MLVGYLGAVIGGFLSAAIPKWTGRPAVTGWRVAVAVGLWLAARLAILFSGTVPPLVGAALDSAFLLLLLAYAAREIVGLHIGPSEAEVFWSDFLQDLVRRGLTGVKLEIGSA